MQYLMNFKSSSLHIPYADTNEIIFTSLFIYKQIISYSGTYELGAISPGTQNCICYSGEKKS